ncbi:MAG: hypothetical protein HXX80_04895 [Nitrososphaerales archaeon]|nr:hypothetical protein [Nitrososphaerales archaeon]
MIEILFYLKHKHSPENCPALRGPEIVAKTFGKIITPEHAKKAGVKVLGMYADAPAHTVGFIIEADNIDRIGAFLGPLLSIGSVETTPVSDLAKTKLIFA